MLLMHYNVGELDNQGLHVQCVLAKIEKLFYMICQRIDSIN